jgi:hypothetical protein
MLLGLCWKVVQKWIDKYRRDRTSPAYTAVNEIAKEILADGLEGYHDQSMLNEKPLDLTYWTLRLHLSIDVGWHINGTIVPMYAWRMLNVHDAELHLGIPDGEGQRWTFEVNLLDKPLESFRVRGISMLPLGELA